MEDIRTISVDKAFLSNAISIFLKMNDKIPENEFFEVLEMFVDEDSGYLILSCNHREETIN